MSEPKTKPQVYLVGAGPGDPDLLTVRAQRVICGADILVYDRLVGSEIVDLAPMGAKKVYVGKADGFHPIPQERISALLVELAVPGRTLVRLKGGDPFVFGRGSEEAEILLEHGIPFEVVPGITAASGCLAEVGVPLTHRGLAAGVRLVTGHRHGNQPLDLNWRSLADPDTTLVLYMALANLEEIRDQLIDAGLPGDTPAAAISGGTTPQQRMVVATLADLPERVGGAGFVPPTLIVIGRVVKFARPRPAGAVNRIGDIAAFIAEEAGHA